MDRKDFLKTVLLMLAGLTIFRWLKPFETAPGLTEARFYGSGDDLAG